MMNNKKADDQDFNEPFDQWLRGTGPSVPDCNHEMEEFLSGFRGKMHADQLVRKKRERRNIKRVASVMSLAVLCVLAFNISDLGSDGFGLVEVEDATMPGRVVRNEFSRDGFNILEGDSEADIHERNQQFLADLGVIIGVEGWMIKGNTRWIVRREFIINGKSSEVGRPSLVPPSSRNEDIGNFIIEDWSDFNEQIETGTISPTIFQEKQLDGVSFQIQGWVLTTKKYGQVSYFKGKPIR